jgi:5,5'-dehydrodivanillate O-demethylase
MADNDRTQKYKDFLQRLPETSAGTPMGQLLRRFWHPVARSTDVATGAAKTIRRFGEALTLYRGESGKPYLIGGRCAHRRTLLHTGWVQGEEIRCIFHGWKYAGSGQCVERPAEQDRGLPDVKIPGYPTREYCGMIFAYLGAGEPPEFDLPRKPAFEQEGAVLFPRVEVWNCNWFQQVEISLDPVHVSFVHRIGTVGTFGAAVSQTIPVLANAETEAGIRQSATRSKNSVRVSDWTFPNANHVRSPGLSTDDPWLDVGVWNVPIDDQSTIRFLLYVAPPGHPEFQARIARYMAEIGDYDPAQFHDELVNGRKYPEDDIALKLTNAQDYVAIIGQGTIYDRENETLGRSDSGIALLRRLFQRELDALAAGQPLKRWKSLEEAAHLPTQIAEPQEAVTADA